MSPAPRRDPAEILDFLAMAYYAVASLLALLSPVPLVLAVVESALADTVLAEKPPPLSLPLEPAALLLVAGLALASLVAWAGRCLQTRRRHRVCVVATAAACLFLPIGTLLALASWPLIHRPEVVAAFRD